jgi:hypothetical protein
VDLVRHGCDEGCKEGRGGDAVGFVDELDEAKCVLPLG